jgi:hypothetical protein
MAERKLEITFPKRSIIYLGLCLTGVMIFLLAGILPAKGTLDDLEADASAIQYRIDEQKALAPLYQALREKSGKKESAILPFPEKGKLPKDKIDTLPMSIGAAVKNSGMTLVSAVPNLAGLTGDAQLIQMDVVLQGNFINFRKFLITLGGIPSLEHIEEIVIQAKPDVKEYRLKLWMAVG